MAKRKFKVKKRLSGGPQKFRKWSDWDIGDVMVGKFQKSGTDKKYGKPIYLFEEVEVFFKDKKIQSEINAAGVLTLNASGKLDKAMEDVTEGQVLQVTFNGKSEITSGKWEGEEANDIEVCLMGEDDDEGEVEEDESPL